MTQHGHVSDDTPDGRPTVEIPRRPYYVYMAASLSRTLYVGVTNDLTRRMSSTD